MKKEHNGMVRKLDTLRRVVPPKSFLDQMKLTAGDKVCITFDGEAIIITKYKGA